MSACRQADGGISVAYRNIMGNKISEKVAEKGRLMARTQAEINRDQIASFKDGDIVRWKDSMCHDSYDRSERFLYRWSDEEGRCMIERIAPEPVPVDVHGHLPRAFTHVGNLRHDC